MKFKAFDSFIRKTQDSVVIPAAKVLDYMLNNFTGIHRMKCGKFIRKKEEI